MAKKERVKIILSGYVEHRVKGRRYVNSRRDRYIHVDRIVYHDLSRNRHYIQYKKQQVNVYCARHNHDRWQGRFLEKTRYAYCDWCGDSHDVDDLTLMINGSLACGDCYEQATAEIKGEA